MQGREFEPFDILISIAPAVGSDCTELEIQLGRTAPVNSDGIFAVARLVL